MQDPPVPKELRNSTLKTNSFTKEIDYHRHDYQAGESFRWLSTVMESGNHHKIVQTGQIMTLLATRHSEAAQQDIMKCIKQQLAFIPYIIMCLTKSYRLGHEKLIG